MHGTAFFVSAAEPCPSKANRVFPERGPPWHDSCVKDFKPGIDQYTGEAALRLIRQGRILMKCHAVAAFTRHIKALNRTAITSDRKK
jgi:hypothetical protein